MDECEMGILRSLGEGGYASAGSDFAFDMPDKFAEECGGYYGCKAVGLHYFP